MKTEYCKRNNKSVIARSEATRQSGEVIERISEATPQTNESKSKAKNQGISHEATKHTTKNDSKFMI